MRETLFQDLISLPREMPGYVVSCDEDHILIIPQRPGEDIEDAGADLSDDGDDDTAETLDTADAVMIDDARLRRCFTEIASTTAFMLKIDHHLAGRLRTIGAAYLSGKADIDIDAAEAEALLQIILWGYAL